jgi:hypothetical protein
MRAIQLYTATVAEAVLEGKASGPQVVVGEDDLRALTRKATRAARSRALPAPGRNRRCAAASRRHESAVARP